MQLSDREIGFFLGIVAGEGHLGGDGRQPQITIRMHVRHEELFRWLVRSFPGGRLYGPYRHDRRHYYQWMARGLYLRDYIVPLFRENMDLVDGHVRARFEQMCERYNL